MKYFLRINGNEFGFAIEGVSDILENDMEITEDDYLHFFELQEQGKQFKIKEVVTGKGLFDYIEVQNKEVL